MERDEMEQHDNSQFTDATDAKEGLSASFDLTGAHDPVLSELWDNKQDAEYDRIQSG